MLKKVFNTQIQKSIETPSDITEKVIDELSARVEANETVTDIIANNFGLVLENKYKTDNNILNLVSEIPTEKTQDNLKGITNKISEILDGVKDKTKATQFLKESLIIYWI